MRRPAIFAALLAAACTGFVVPAFADGDDNDPHMKLFNWDGTYYLESRPQHMKEPKQNGEKKMDGTGRGGPMMKGPGKMPNDGKKPGMSPGRP